MNPSVPCLLHEDEHLLVVNKPAGLNTHHAAPLAGEGLYDWLRGRDPRWAQLGIVHRLDKDTSGVLVFSKTSEASRSLTRQFSEGRVGKRYLLCSDRPHPRPEFSVDSFLRRVGERYQSVPQAGLSGQRARTAFQFQGAEVGRFIFTAVPATGRTHQIRVHAADSGIPILGDRLYGGSDAPRLYLHSESLSFRHPATERMVTFAAEPNFGRRPALQLREALIDPAETSIYRLLHGAADGIPSCYLDRLGPFLVASSAEGLSPDLLSEVQGLAATLGARAVYHKILTTGLSGKPPGHAGFRLIAGTAPDHDPVVLENQLKFKISFGEGYSFGLFHDQRDNRRRLLRNYAAPAFSLFSEPGPQRSMLNTFAYTCGFSLCGARLGLRTVSVDLSRKYLDWGRSNFELNDLDQAGHEFLQGDVFEWLKRFQKKGRRFDLVVLDPPTFSRSKERGVFRAERDYPTLVEAALPLVERGGVLFAASNAGTFTPESFRAAVRRAVGAGRRKIAQEFYAPQPPDFPTARLEPAHLKSLWLRLE